MEFEIFEMNYIEAWNQQGMSQYKIFLFAGNDYHEMHIGSDWMDDKLMRVLRAHARLFKVRRGWIGLLSLKALTHIAISQLLIRTRCF